MKLLLATVALCIGTSALAVELTIKIKNVKESVGTIFIGVYNDKEKWPGGEPFRALSTAAESPETTVTVDVPEGTYAVSVHHDVNDNGKMDTRFRFPKEPWAVSNAVPARFAPPNYDKMVFEVGSEPFTTELVLKD